MPEEIYGRHTYYKGASIHHNLRAYLGDEMYRNACQFVLSEYWDSYMDPDMFIAALESIQAWTYRLSSTIKFSSRGSLRG